MVDTQIICKQGHKLNVVDKDSGDMDDTLANLRKRLKGSKKSVGSVIPKIRSHKDVPPIHTVTNSNLNSTGEGHDMVDGASDVALDGTVNKNCLGDASKPIELYRVSVPMPNVHDKVYSPTVRNEAAVITPDRHMHLGEPYSESGYVQEKNLVMCDCGIQVNFEEGSFDSKTQVAICQKCKFSSHHDASNGGGFQINTLKDGTAESSPVSVALCEDENFRGDAVSLPTSGKPSTLQCTERIAKKRKLGNMVYGDMNWENEQGFLDSQSDKSFKGSDTCDLVPSISKETEIGRAAAVTDGLKAQSVSPIEKIILKEILKRKGSHQEYLVCRNYILGLWSKNVSRILPITECGVFSGPSQSE